MKENLIAISSEKGVIKFINEVSNSSFITYSNMASLCSISTGTLINEGGGWLHFTKDNVNCFVAKKNIRTTISWDQLNAVGCVYGSKIVTISSKKYKVRLLKSYRNDPSPSISAFYLEELSDSEWAKMFYPLIKDDTYVPIPPRDINAPYTMSDLQMNSYPYSWCQETILGTPANRVLMGYMASCYYTQIASNNLTVGFRGWRPCLEEVI